MEVITTNNFDYSVLTGIHNFDSYGAIIYFYTHVDDTDIEIQYYADESDSEKKEGGLATLRLWGGVEEITEKIYVVYYTTPYV